MLHENNRQESTIVPTRENWRSYGGGFSEKWDIAISARAGYPLYPGRSPGISGFVDMTLEKKKICLGRVNHKHICKQGRLTVASLANPACTSPTHSKREASSVNKMATVLGFISFHCLLETGG
jgi:hypothetical protein